MMNCCSLPALLLVFATAVGTGAINRLDPSASGNGNLVDMGFEDCGALAEISVSDPSRPVVMSVDNTLSHSGNGSLRIAVVDPGGGEEIHPSIDIELPETIPSTEIKAISCWVHVPEDLSRYLFGRYDARILLNGGKPLWSLPALPPGWTLLRWELSNLYSHPEIRSVRLQFGPILPGFGKGAIHVDRLVLEGMVDPGDLPPSQLLEIIADREAPWTVRFQAIQRLEADCGLEALPPLFAAVADGPEREGYNPASADMQTAYIDHPPEGSETVRSTAKDALGQIVRRAADTDQDKLRELLEAALRSDDGRIRLAAVGLLGDTGMQEWARACLLQALLDEIYYIREMALEELESLGLPGKETAQWLAAALAGEDLERQIAIVRCLGEMGYPAVGALDQIIPILRDPEADEELRQWCLRAAWWIDERVLRPGDWALGLSLQPGEIHRHLLNRSMQRLQAAGPAAVPALEQVLDNEDPVLRARAAVLLRKAGPSGIRALERAQDDPIWYVRAAAGKAVPDNPPKPGPVETVRDGDLVYFSNALIEVGFALSKQDPGPFWASFPGGPNLIDSDWLYKLFAFKDTQAQNIIERVWFQKIRGVPMSKDLEWRQGDCSPGQAEMICRYPGSPEYPLEWEIHYILRSGDSGFYSFMVVRNVSGADLPLSTIYNSPDAIGMIRQLVAPTWGMFDTAILHDNFKWPAKFTDTPDFSLYPDIYQATYRMPDGGVDAKHEGTNYELESPVIGYAGKEGAFWQILPSLEFCGASWPWNQRSDANHNMFVLSLEDKYYIPVGIDIKAGWEKHYGPVFHYLNRGENTEEMWEDAKRRAAREVRDWPYDWLKQEGYHDRGKVTGRVEIGEGIDPEGAWALLARPGGDIPPSIRFGQWWRDVGSYHYCASVGRDGSFTINDVRSGAYDLFVWHPEVYGEFRRSGITVEGGGTVQAGRCLLSPVRRGKLLWQLGRPNRTMTEFRNGGNYHQWETYLRFREDFPDGMEFVIGESDPAFDWNYLQPAIVRGEQTPTRARVRFGFDPRIPGDPLLTLVAGGRGVRMEVLVNGTPIGDLEIEDIGLQHIRTAPYGELAVKEYAFDRSLLVQGQNELVLRFTGGAPATSEARQWRYPLWTNYIAYDFIRMEMMPAGRASAQNP